MQVPVPQLKETRTRMTPKEIAKAQTERARINIRIALAIANRDGTNVAKAAGLSQNALNTFLRGESSMSLENVLRVCAELDIPVALVIKPDGVTEARLRLHRILERLSDHELDAALDTVRLAKD